MLEAVLNAFYSNITDPAAVLQSAINAAAWVLLCHGDDRRKNMSLRMLGELVLLFAVMELYDAVLNGLRVAYSLDGIFALLWTVVEGAVTFWFVRRFSAYRRGTCLVLWSFQYTWRILLIAASVPLYLLLADMFVMPVSMNVFKVFVWLLLILFALYLRYFRFHEYESIPKGFLIQAAGIVVCSMVLLTVGAVLNGHQNPQFVLCMVIVYSLFFLIMLMSVVSVSLVAKEQAEMAGLYAEKQRLQSERDKVKITESTLEDLRCARHDLRNHFSYMQILLENGRYEDLRTYFNRLANNLPVQLNAIDCGNRSLNPVLNMVITMARNEQISVEHQLVVPPVLPFSDDDLCALLSNLMDNAIEECKRLRELDGREVGIRMEINPYMNYLYIMFSNPTDRVALEPWKGGLRTTKGDEQIHGYGTRIVSKVAEKYDGYVEYKLKEQRFVAQVLLNMLKEDGA